MKEVENKLSFSEFAQAIHAPIKNIIEALIIDKQKNRKDCKYLILGRKQYERLWFEIYKDIVHIPLPSITTEFLGLKVLLVDSDILEVAGDFSVDDL